MDTTPGPAPAPTPQYRELGADEEVQTGDEISRVGDEWNPVKEWRIGCSVGGMGPFKFRRRVTQEVVGEASTGTQIAEFERAKANKHTKEQREALIADGMARIDDADRQARARKVAEDCVSHVTFASVIDRSMATKAITTALLQFDFGQQQEQPVTTPGKSQTAARPETSQQSVGGASALDTRPTSPATVHVLEQGQIANRKVATDHESHWGDCSIYSVDPKTNAKSDICDCGYIRKSVSLMPKGERLNDWIRHLKAIDRQFEATTLEQAVGELVGACKQAHEYLDDLTDFGCLDKHPAWPIVKHLATLIQKHGGGL